MRDLRCLVGYHRWSPWAFIAASREIEPGIWRRAQGRRCVRCGFADAARFGQDCMGLDCDMNPDCLSIDACTNREW